MEYKDKYEVKEETTTGYTFKIKLEACSEVIRVTLQRHELAFQDQWEMKWNQKLPLYMIAILIRTIFDIKGSEIKYLLITLPAFSKEQQKICFTKNPKNEVSSYVEALMKLAPDEVIF